MAKKDAYNRLANAMLKNQELEDYYLRLDKEKQLLVFFNFYFFQNKGRRKIKMKNGKEYVKMFKQRKR